jgi:membrane dipeptidase
MSVPRPRPWTRRITPAHARIVAATGGVIGLWPPAGLFPDLEVGQGRVIRQGARADEAHHVGAEPDMVRPDHIRHPGLLARFTPDETAGILGGNYLRVARACLAA